MPLARYRSNDYSAPTAYGHRQVRVKGCVHKVAIACGREAIARHTRSYPCCQNGPCGGVKYEESRDLRSQP
jgi:hypothetical protein